MLTDKLEVKMQIALDWSLLSLSPSKCVEEAGGERIGHNVRSHSFLQ